MRAQAVSAVKSMVVERPHKVDAPLAGCVVELLTSALADVDRHVRKAAVVSLSAVCPPLSTYEASAAQSLALPGCIASRPCLSA